MIGPLLLLCALVSAQAATVSLNWARSVGNQGTTTISVGDTVSWVWTESIAHTVDATGGAFSSGTKSSGTFSYTFNTAGSYAYRCTIHNGMQGVIAVVATVPTAVPTNRPTMAPTPQPTTSAPVSQSTLAPTAPSVAPSAPPTKIPTQSPTATPTAAPSADPASQQSPLLTYPHVISSGVSTPSSWNATLHVRAHRVVTEVVEFNARLYCYTAGANEVCSYPGPTIHVSPGDNFTLLLINDLGSNPASEAGMGESAMNKMHQPNTTNIHTHGLHVDPNVDSIYKAALPEGGSLLYRYEVPVAHAPGLHWYHAHTHGSSAMQLMGGLVGALIVLPPSAGTQAGLPTTSTNAHTPFDFNIPASIRDAQSFLLVVTYVVFTQSTVNGVVSQGCGLEFTCNAENQAPLCYGNETVSPYDPFRQYTYHELSADTGSTLPVDATYNDTFTSSRTGAGSGTHNYHLVNGQFQPSIVVREGEPFVLRVLHASGGKPLPLSLSQSSACNLSVIAWDGVYLDANLYETEVHLVAASRAELQVICTQAGVFSLETEGEAVLFIVVNATAGTSDPTSDYAYISDGDLAGINRPYYLQDLTGDSGAEVAVDSTYSVTISQDHTNASVCGFWIGAGTDCSSVSGEASAQCPYHQFKGQQGVLPASYLEGNKLVTFAGAVNEWKFYGMGSAFHPLHVHVNHFQIISYHSEHDAGADKYFRKGQWRDTVPPIADVMTFRFIAADYVGETVLHCHFLRHEDLGMMDSYLVTDANTYAEIHSSAPTTTPTRSPTAAPTVSPAPSATPTVLPTAQPTVAPTSDSAVSSTEDEVIIGASVGGALAVLAVGAAVYYVGGMQAVTGYALASAAPPKIVPV